MLILLVYDLRSHLDAECRCTLTLELRFAASFPYVHYLADYAHDRYFLDNCCEWISWSSGAAGIWDITLGAGTTVSWLVALRRNRPFKQESTHQEVARVKFNPKRACMGVDKNILKVASKANPNSTTSCSNFEELSFLVNDYQKNEWGTQGNIHPVADGRDFLWSMSVM